MTLARRAPHDRLALACVAALGLSGGGRAIADDPKPAPIATDEHGSSDARRCPEEMALVGDAFCVDRYEAHLEKIGPDGSVSSWPPNQPVDGAPVRARNARGALPQAYVRQTDALAACASAGKRLCTDAEWLKACRGAPATRFPYGARRRSGACNDRGVEVLHAVHAEPGAAPLRDPMNDPRLHLVPGGAAPAGRFDRCRSEAGVHDMVGNLHEWTANPDGTLRGGYYLDTSTLGEGCDYVTPGHDVHYRDYSTGFRCCADAARSRD